MAWADNGAREGDVADKASQTPEWKDGWQIQPDVVVSMPEAYHLGATGKGEIKEFFIPSPFKEDTWVTSIEIRPGDPSVVHHAIVQVGVQSLVPDHGVRSSNIAGTPPFVPGIIRIRGNTPNGGGYSNVIARERERQTGRGAFMTMEAVYAPGSQPMNFRYTDSAKLIPGGKPIRLEVHYTPNGKETTDRTMVGFILAKSPAKRRFIIMAPEHMADSRKAIPAGDANYETTGELVFNQDVNLVWFMPHMHLRGKDMTYRLIFPNRQEETVLSARFNFHWQLGYELEHPIRVPKGTRMVVTAHHDNSANNPLNPSPGAAVGWGQMTADEMMLPWFGVVVARDAQPDAIATYKPGDLDLDGPLRARKR